MIFLKSKIIFIDWLRPLNCPADFTEFRSGTLFGSYSSSRGNVREEKDPFRFEFNYYANIREINGGHQQEF
jgi:hypothetical protein